MDPYLEHPVLWPGVHTRLLVALANQLGPKIRPRYVASVEERVFIENPDQERVPDVWVQKTLEEHRAPGAQSGTAIATPLVVEVQQLEIREHYIAILDRYHDFGVVTVIELVSPSNKAAGPGRDSYLAKQREVRKSECHLVEIDLLRRGTHVMSIPESHLRPAKPFDYLVLRESMACPQSIRALSLPAARPATARSASRWPSPIPTYPLAIQSALEHAYGRAGYMLRVRYDEPCIPPLPADGPGVGLRRSGRPTARPIRSSSRTRTAAEFARNEGEAPGLGAPPGRRQYWSAAMTSPPARVMSAFQTSGLIAFLMKRTEPSANAALKPPGWGEPAP